MAKRKESDFNDAILRAAKRKYQEESRKLVRSGARTQDSMTLIPKSAIKRSKIRRRTDEF
ncbi:hypothetical protein BLA6993_04183 [Burkholderia lata]|uniref:hypothetical protein n=1 Tax=Burkholderia lata (strain ATCC 17760 / DSM 23089 / LMG 22485 / NCIMB 9086 / R18194 / 383) TaxID=482957 RepID=UPI00145413D8|nr:hypothetical protein [Burkholderia lata]VWB87941.1 hypothetical protein BLA6993_04183 [Burkholderia lata]